jgi:hypothetical protein
MTSLRSDRGIVEVQSGTGNDPAAGLKSSYQGVPDVR